jgi:hypothetical protein
MGWWRSIKRRRRRFARLSTAERAVLWRAWLLLPAASALIRARGLERGQDWTSKLARLLGLDSPRGLAGETVRRLVGHAARLHLRKSGCLVQSVVTRACLPELGLEIGVRRHGGGLEAHAWVEELGVPLGEREGVVGDYRRLGLAPKSAARRSSKLVIE